MEIIDFLIGIDNKNINAPQMGIRAVIIFLSALLMLKIGNKRFLGRTTAFDFLLGIIIGSVLSRAITGNAPFFPAIFASLVLIFVHWLFGLAALHSNWFSKFVKGRTRSIIKDGEINLKEMKQAHIGSGDLEMELRSETGSDDLDKIKDAYFERSGKMSFIKYPEEAKVIDVTIEKGIQTIRIKIE